MFMFNLLDASALTASGADFISLGSSAKIKLPSSLAIVSSLSGSTYSTPDNAYAASTWVHALFLYNPSSKTYKVALNGTAVHTTTALGSFPSITETVLTALGNTLLKHL